MIHITLADARSALRDAADAKGWNYIYEVPAKSRSCVYAVDGAPSCIVGHALKTLGVDIEWAVRRGGSIRLLAYYAKEDEKFTITPLALRLMAVAQVAQDLSVSWGEAINIAEASFSDEELHQD